MLTTVLQNADFILRMDVSKRQKKRSTTASGTGPTSPLKGGSASGAAFSTGVPNTSSSSASSRSRFAPSDAEEQAAQTRNARLFEVSKALDDQAFKWFVGSLCRLDGEMMGVPTHVGGELDPTESSLMGPLLEDGGHVTKSKRSGINVMRTLVSALHTLRTE